MTEIILQTPRLLLRPLHPKDAPALSRRCGVPAVTDSLLSIDTPWEEAAIQRWIRRYSWHGVPGYRLAICLGGELIGAVGFAQSVGEYGFGYFLAPQFWGNGYTTEAARVFLADAFARYEITAFESAAFSCNHASHRVLTKLGFRKTGQGLSRATATLEPQPETRYRLTEQQFRAAIA